jgi:uncharacterized membrane protein
MHPQRRRIEVVEGVPEEFGIARLFLVTRGKQLTVASYLGPSEREDFAAQLGNALNEARRGATRTVFN